MPKNLKSKKVSVKDIRETVVQLNEAGKINSDLIPESIEIEEGIIFVSKLIGNDTTGLRERKDRPFYTLTEAQNQALPGDLIYVLDGVYSNEDNLGKDEVNWYFEDGVEVRHEIDYDRINAPIFDLSGKRCRIMGNGVFVPFALLTTETSDRLCEMFEAKEILAIEDPWGTAGFPTPMQGVKSWKIKNLSTRDTDKIGINISGSLIEIDNLSKVARIDLEDTGAKLYIKTAKNINSVFQHSNAHSLILIDVLEDEEAITTGFERNIIINIIKCNINLTEDSGFIIAKFVQGSVTVASGKTVYLTGNVYTTGTVTNNGNVIGGQFIQA